MSTKLLLNTAFSKKPKGFTMIELLVAMAISAVVVVAAMSALMVSRQGFTAVDVASQLRQDSRFAVDIMQRVSVQTGFQDIANALAPPNLTDTPEISGCNNQLFNNVGACAARTMGVDGYGSDVLILNYQTSVGNQLTPGAVITSDGGIIDCSGTRVTAIPSAATDRVVSVFHVAVGADGEPSLMCSSGTNVGGVTTLQTAQPLVRGVENFQVLYGVDGVTANVATAATVTPTWVATNYLRADEIVVPSDVPNTNINWGRVRNIRIGLVMRGPVGSNPDSITQTFYPLGMGKNSSSGADGSALASASDINTSFTPALDRRMRQSTNFTVHFRNVRKDSTQ